MRSATGVAAANSNLQKAQDALGVLGDVNQRIRAAQEAVEEAQLNYNYCFVKAPFDGYVTNLNIPMGGFQAIRAMVAGLPNVEETLNWVRLHQRFRVRIIFIPSDAGHPYRMGQTAVVTVRGE